MLKHWEHTEYLSDEDYKSYTTLNKSFKPSIALPYNTAVYVANDKGNRVEGIYDGVVKAIRPLKNTNAPNRDLRLYLDAIATPEITMLGIDGLVGTGKTSTCIQALVTQHLSAVKKVISQAGMQEKKLAPDVHRILIAKPQVNASGEEYGFLPGDIVDKFDPTINNYKQYFNRFHVAGFESLVQSGHVEILPLGFVRGLDAENMTIIVDESQNAKELITIATRKANKCRIFFLGDTSPFQIDRDGNTPKNNGLGNLIDLLAGAPYFQYIEMKSLEHIVRSDEVRDIIRRLFKKHGTDPQEWIL